MKKLLLSSFIIVGLFLVTSMQNGEATENDAYSVSETMMTNNQQIDIAGNWVITDWDSDVDQGGYDPGDPWNFNPNGVFKGFGICGDGLCVGKWSVKNTSLTISIDTTFAGISNMREPCTWTAHIKVSANIKDFTGYAMRLSGNVFIEATNDKGELSKQKQRMEIKLSRS